MPQEITMPRSQYQARSAQIEKYEEEPLNQTLWEKLKTLYYFSLLILINVFGWYFIIKYALRVIK